MIIFNILYINNYSQILDMTTELLRSKDGPVLASAALCVAELCSSMRTHALYSLNKFVPAILKLLETHCHQTIPDVMVISIVSALQKIVESLGNFLSLYLDQLLSELTMLSSLYTDTEHPKVFMVFFSRILRYRISQSLIFHVVYHN